MAPSPQHDSEPKAPDKSGAAAAQSAADNRAPPAPAPAAPQPAESKHVGGLDDGALRALLDEAITYKCPKDREGKSLLFKELLEEAEQDEEACGGGGGGGGGWRGGGREAARGRRGGGRRGERLPHSGSLQDLVAALAADVPPQRRRHAPVSARTHHGGSLPSGVDRSFLLGEEPPARGGADYIATVRCVNPPPLTERRVSVSDAHAATEMELLNRSKIPCIPVTYTSRATLDISSGGRAHTTTTCSNQVRTRRAPPRRRSVPAACEVAAQNTLGPISIPTDNRPGDRLLCSLQKPMIVEKKVRRKKRSKTSGNTQPKDFRSVDATDSVMFAPAVLYEPSTSKQPSSREALSKNENVDCKPTSREYIRIGSGKHLKGNVPTSFAQAALYDSEKNRVVRAPKKSLKLRNRSDLFTNKSLKILSDSIALNFHVDTPPSRFNDSSVLHRPKTASEKHNSFSQGKNYSYENVNFMNDILSESISPGATKSDFEILTSNSIGNQGQARRELTRGPPEVLFSRQHRPTRPRVLQRHRQNLINTCNSQNSFDLPKFIPKVGLHPSKKTTSKPVLTRGIDKFGQTSKLTLEPFVDIEEENETEESTDQISDDFSAQCSIRKSEWSQYGINWEYPKKRNATNFIPFSNYTDSFENTSLGLSSKTSVNDDFVKTDALDISNVNNEPHVHNCIQAINLYKKYFTKSDPLFLAEVPEKSLAGDAVINKVDVIATNLQQDYLIEMHTESPKITAEQNFDKNANALVSSKGQFVESVEEQCISVSTAVLENVTFTNSDENKIGLCEQSDLCVSEDSEKALIELNSQINRHVGDKLEGVAKQLPLSRSAKILTVVKQNYRSNVPVVFICPSLKSNSSSSSETSFNTKRTTEQVDSGITFGCITTPAVVTSCNTTSSAPSPCASVDSKPRTGGVLAAGSINGLAALSRNYGGCSSADDFKKSLDENGNALQTFNSPLSGSSQHKKPRRKKSSKNETVAMSEQIDGYQGNKDISELLRFIESDAEHGRAHKHKQHHDKRSTERRARDKPAKGPLQRANSMEELSLSKLEDLTHDKPLALRKHKKERVSDGGGGLDGRKSERRSWGDDSRSAFYHSNSEEQAPPPTLPRDKRKAKNKSAEWPHDSDLPTESLEFQTVTKKKKTRKRHSPQSRCSGGGGGERGAELLYRKMRPSSPDRRRKSAPPSDKSNDSNDDLDSVHSLPAEPTAERCAVRPGSASSGGTPQASYADIARTRHNIPDLIESCNFYADLEPPPLVDERGGAGRKDICRSDSAPVESRRSPPKATEESPGPTYDAENYPALEARSHRAAPRTKEPKHPEPRPTRVAERKPKSEAAAEERAPAAEPPPASGGEEEAAPTEPPDVVLAPDRRPPVILLDEASRPREMDGITFGFDINEQLLNGEEPPFPSSDEFPAINEKRPRARCDLLREFGAVQLRAGVAALCYVPPAPLAHGHSAHLHKIVNYVGAAWEDIMKCPSGKVRYFSQ